MIPITDVLIVLLSILIFLECFDRLKNYTASLYRTISSFWFDRKVSVEDTIEEKTEEDDFLTGKYDVHAFRERMEKMKDEDGLYDIPYRPSRTNFTGVEIITESSEIEADRKAGS